MTLPQLAAMVCATLDAQKRYFKSRSQADLIASKTLEKELRQAAEGALLAEAPSAPDSELARQLLATPTGCCTSTAYALFRKYRRPFDSAMGPNDDEIIKNLRWLAVAA